MNLLLFLLFSHIFATRGFVPAVPDLDRGNPKMNRFILTISGLSRSDENIRSDGGYKFGDISWTMPKLVSKRTTKLTGKDKYEFGDVSRYLDQRAKAGVSSLTGKPDHKFGDVTLWVDSVSKAKVANFTGKASFDDYQVGDITCTVVRKVQSEEFDASDVFLAL
jgi:hypothetical protein